MSVRIKMRYDDLAAWNSANPTLLPGEFAVAKHTNGTIEVRVGTDTETTWDTAPQISGTGTPIEGLDFTDLQAGEVLFWDGTSWYGRGLDELISGGNKISVSRNNDGTINIAYFDTTYTLSSFSLSGSNSFTTSVQEVGTTWTGNLTFTVTLNDNASSVDMASATTSASSEARVGGWPGNPQTLIVNENSNGANATINSLTIPSSNSFSWFTTSDRSISFNANTVSKTIDEAGNSISAQFANTSVSKSYGWKLKGIADTSDTLTAQNVVDAIDQNSANNILTNPSSLVQTVSSITTLTWTNAALNGLERYLYVLISARSSEITTNVAYGWNPKFLEFDTGFENTNNWTMLGVAQADNDLYYKVYRYNTPQTFANNIFQFKITTQ